MIILDTNVISELAGPAPAPAVLAWARTQPPDQVFTTAICEAELRFGIVLMPAGRRRDTLARAVAVTLTAILCGRVLPFDRAAAEAYADLAARWRRAGRIVGQADLQIAGIAIAREAAAIATRNVGHFEGCGVTVINPGNRPDGGRPGVTGRPGAPGRPPCPARGPAPRPGPRPRPACPTPPPPMRGPRCPGLELPPSDRTRG